MFLLSPDATFSDFASIRMQLAWLSHTRPDVMFEVSQLTQVTSERFESYDKTIIKKENGVVTYDKEHHIASFGFGSDYLAAHRIL